MAKYMNPTRDSWLKDAVGKLIEEHGTGEVLKAMADHHFEDQSDSERNMAMCIEALAQRVSDKEKGEREWREFRLCI